MQHEHDVPDYASDPEGKVMRWTAISGWRIPARRRVSPAYAASWLQLFTGRHQLRATGYGLLFVCYQHDLEKGFLTVQKGSMAKRWRNTLNLSAAVIFCAAGGEGRERLFRKRVIAGLCF